ncbi:hypothetical protein JYT16_00060 [Gemmatimonas aurantiaca]|nr:hypothetical protein [Gemmatimonas aurantiaca]
MAYKFKCADCGAEIVTNFLKHGEHASCRKCSALNTVPTDAEEIPNEDVRSFEPSLPRKLPPQRDAVDSGNYQEARQTAREGLIGNLNHRSAFDYLQLGYESCKGNFGVAIGGYLTIIFINIFLQLIPILGALVLLFIGPALQGGVTILHLNIARDTDPQFDNVFDGFKRFSTLLGIQFALIFAAMVIVTPVAIVMILALGGFSIFENPGADSFPIVLLFMGAVPIVISVALASVLIIFAFVIAIDTPKVGVMDCFRLSYRLAINHYWKIVLFFILGALMTMFAFLLLFIPALFAIQILGVGLMRLYMDLRADYEKSMN